MCALTQLAIAGCPDRERERDSHCKACPAAADAAACALGRFKASSLRLRIARLEFTTFETHVVHAVKRSESGEAQRRR